MPNCKPSLFLTPPSLGGKLSLVNANFWVIFVLLLRSGYVARDLPYIVAYAGDYLIFVMGFHLIWLVPTITGPTGYWAILPTIGLPGVWGILVAVVILGINAFVWGYGVAWCITWCQKRLQALFSTLTHTKKVIRKRRFVPPSDDSVMQ